MKKLFLVALFFLITPQARAGEYRTVVPGKGIAGTAHDLRYGQPAGDIYFVRDVDNAYGEAGDLNRICIWCHAPHHSMNPAVNTEALTYLPLWNHQSSAMVYQTYSHGEGRPEDGGHASTAQELANQPGAVSKLCLSCHDGSVAVNEYGLAPGDIKSSGIRKGDAPSYLTTQYTIGAGGELFNHHPIGFDYEAVAAVDDEIAPSSATLGLYRIEELLWEGRMECTTCHDVHNTKNQGGKFLWAADRDSRFCLSCHLK